VASLNSVVVARQTPPPGTIRPRFRLELARHDPHSRPAKRHPAWLDVLDHYYFGDLKLFIARPKTEIARLRPSGDNKVTWHGHALLLILFGSGLEAKDGKLAAVARENQTSKTMKRITVSPADDHSVVREVFPRMLELEGDFGVVGEAAEGRQGTKSSASGFG